MITKKSKHDQCRVFVQLEHYTRINHYASLRCQDHNAYIQWLSKSDVDQLKDLGIKVKEQVQ